MGSDALFSIELLERELKSAEDELSNAVAAKMKAQEVEVLWQTEVTSLKSLIEVRRKRIGAVVENGTDSGQQSFEVVEPIDAYDEPTSTLSFTHHNGTEINRVDWISGAVAASGSYGITPPEIMISATKAGVAMHKNYPYSVLKTLMDRNQVYKRRDRYYKKET
jgi:hypothetical protein